MSWNNCKKCVFMPRSSFTSALFKVLVTLKLLHGSRLGARGSTLEDIAMHMIKHFCLDGDIKSQVLATLKYGVKMNLIQKRKEKFSLILPASSIHLAPCKFKNEETERIHCIFPPAWQSNACNDIACGAKAPCCGKRDRGPTVGCKKSSNECEEDACGACKPKRRKPPCFRQPQNSCSECFEPPPKCPRRAPPCSMNRRPKCNARQSRSQGLYDNYCAMCPPEDDPCKPCGRTNQEDAYKNCGCDYE